MKKVLTGIFWFFVLISCIGLPAILIDYFGNGVSIIEAFTDVFSFLGYYIGGGVLICAPFYFVASRMKNAAEIPKSKAFIILEWINALTILFSAIIVLIYFIPNGLYGIRSFYEQYFWWFVAFIASAAFSIYWWWLKKGRDFLVDGSEQYKIGCEHLTAGDINEALKYFDSAIKSGYLNAHLFYDRARCLGDFKYYSEAIEDFNKAIEINSEKADMYHARHFCKMEIGDFYGALSDLREAIRLSKLDNENNNFWNEYAKKTGYRSATERYEMDFNDAKLSLQIYKERELSDAPDSKIKLDKIKANHQINKERNRREIFKTEPTTTQIDNHEKDEMINGLSQKAREILAAKIRSLKSTGSNESFEKFNSSFDNELDRPESTKPDS